MGICGVCVCVWWVGWCECMCGTYLFVWLFLCVELFVSLGISVCVCGGGRGVCVFGICYWCVHLMGTKGQKALCFSEERKFNYVNTAVFAKFPNKRQTQRSTWYCLHHIEHLLWQGRSSAWLLGTERRQHNTVYIGISWGGEMWFCDPIEWHQLFDWEGRNGGWITWEVGRSVIGGTVMVVTECNCE